MSARDRLEIQARGRQAGKSDAPTFDGTAPSAEQLISWLRARGYTATFVHLGHFTRNYVNVEGEGMGRIYSWSHVRVVDGVLDVYRVDGQPTWSSPGARPSSKTFDGVLRSAFAAGMRVNTVVSNEQVDYAFAEWKRGQLP